MVLLRAAQTACLHHWLPDLCSGRQVPLPPRPELLPPRPAPFLPNFPPSLLFSFVSFLAFLSFFSSTSAAGLPIATAPFSWRPSLIACYVLSPSMRLLCLVRMHLLGCVLQGRRCSSCADIQ